MIYVFLAIDGIMKTFIINHINKIYIIMNDIFEISWTFLLSLTLTFLPKPIPFTGKPPWSQFNNNVTTLYHIACTDTLPDYPSPASVELITFLNVRYVALLLLIISPSVALFVLWNIHLSTFFCAFVVLYSLLLLLLSICVISVSHTLNLKKFHISKIIWNHMIKYFQ